MAETKNANKHNNNRCERCGRCDKNILPLCCLVSILTALLVVIFLSLGVTQKLLPGGHDNSVYSGDFAELAKSDAATNEHGLVELSGGTVIDMLYLSKGTGLIAVTNQATNSDTTATFLQKIQAAANGARIYQYDYSQSGESADDVVFDAFLGDNSDGAPTLLYVRNGEIYDRLDDANSDADISSFIAKYR
ncbi:hypothetical protein IIY67_01090 [Candidatus Saccharibacteria bacterium]|nr:hypothetical protein [Candidatus Saccharibacteria bacterium]